MEPAGQLWGHKWGFRDTRFAIQEDGSVMLTGSRYDLSGYRMYDFLPYVDEVLGTPVDWSRSRSELEGKPVPQPRQDDAFCQAVQEHFGPDQYSFDDRTRLLHSHGQTSADEVFRVVYHRLERVVDMVFYCQSEQDAVRIIGLAKQHDVCLVPFGGGTSVSCALKLPQNDDRMMVAVNMRRMNRVEWTDGVNLRACVQAGITGSELELALAQEGFVCGHEPDSMELSTLGGWVATNASGMKKNRYGNIEQIVEKVTMVTPEGVLEPTIPTPRASIGMQPQNLLFGSEGNLGLITKAIIKIHPAPEVKEYESLIFPDMELGLECLHQLARTSFVPASIRLVDNAQFRFGQSLKPRATGGEALINRLKKFYVLKLRGFDPYRMVAATILMEGSQREVAFQKSNIFSLARRFQGLPAGAENGRRGYRLTYAIAYIRDFLADYHVIGETFETSVAWSDVFRMCEAVQQGAREGHREFGLPGRPYVSYRVTQIYHTGVCVYFIYGIYTRGIENAEQVFGRIEHSLREAILENGGSISHHHGVGKLRKDFMKDTLSQTSIELLKNMKQSIDPQNVFGIRNNVFSD